MSAPQTNWAGNFTYLAEAIERPKSLDELQSLVGKADRLKALATRHSFNSIADTFGVQVSTDALPLGVEIDSRRRQVRVPAAITYGKLGPQLTREGFALPNLASLPHISVAGACATATHGSGNDVQVLPTAVAEIEFVAADGSLVQLKREHEEFNGVIVGLGTVGVATALTLDLVPAFEIAQEVYEQLPMSEVTARFDEITGAAYSVSLFTDWKTEYVNQVWFKRLAQAGDVIDSGPQLFGARRATSKMHPLSGISPVNCTEQLGVAGPWYERLPHFKLDFTPSVGEELQSEYLVPRFNAVKAIAAVHRAASHFAHLLQVTEIRTMAADDLWLSPSYGQPCVGIHFTWMKDWEAVSKVLPIIERALAPYEARPHWGKLFSVSPEIIESRYERLPAFRRLLAKYDPSGKFRNEFVRRNVFGEM